MVNLIRGYLFVSDEEGTEKKKKKKKKKDRQDSMTADTTQESIGKFDLHFIRCSKQLPVEREHDHRLGAV